MPRPVQLTVPRSAGEASGRSFSRIGSIRRLGNLVAGARLLSVGQYSVGIANSIAHDPSLNAALRLPTALTLGILVTVGALVVAVRRLASFSLKGEPA